MELADVRPPEDLAALTAPLEEMREQMEAQKAAVIAANGRLYAALDYVAYYTRGDAAAAVEAWHALALGWMNDASATFDRVQTLAAQGFLAPDAWAAMQAYTGDDAGDAFSATVGPWLERGQELARGARKLGTLLADDTLTADVAAALERAPVELRHSFDALVAAAVYAAKKVVQGAGEVAKEAALGAVPVLLLLGGAVALVLYGIKKSGGHLSLGPVGVG